MADNELPDEEAASRVIELLRRNVELWEHNGIAPGEALKTMMKEELPDNIPAAQSHQGVMLGTRAHPFNFAQVTTFQNSNEHHATCLHTKVAACVGLGFQTEEDQKDPEVDPLTGQPKKKKKTWAQSEIDKVLNPLCRTSFQDVLNDVAEDYFQVGNGFMEVVRGVGGPVVGLYHIPAPEIFFYVENAQYDFHYQIIGVEGAGERRFAAFGDSMNMLERAGEGNKTPGMFVIPTEQADDIRNKETVSEVIHFRKPSSVDRWYGMPDYLSTVPTIELVMMITQHKFDFFLNRGVPEFILFIIGALISKPDWTKIENQLKANIGLGNSRKSMAINLAGDASTIEAKIEKLGVTSESDDSFGPDNDTCAMKIVTAHRVPPLLAGIQIPGKLGANNELVNAMMAFQALAIGQDQRIFEQTFANTLGNKAKNGGLALEPKHFLLKTILEEIDLPTADTVGRMKQPLAEAQAEGRDLKSGKMKD